MNNTQQDFDGVFRFTNATSEDFIFLWNNIEYKFKAGTCSPMIIKNETSENVQEIRKKAAYKLAVREFFKSPEYSRLAGMGNGLPPTYQDEVLTPWIQQCLEPLPIGKADVTEPTEAPKKMKAFKPVGANTDLKSEFAKEIEELN
jgi:hypothetical protein